MAKVKSNYPVNIGINIRKTQMLLFYHFLLNLLGLLVGIVVLSFNILNEKIVAHNILMPYELWAKLVIVATKPAYLGCYVVGLLVIFIYGLVVSSLLALNKSGYLLPSLPLQESAKQHYYFIGLLVMNLLILLGSMIRHSSTTWILVLLGWLAMFLIPYYKNINQWLSKPISLSFKKLVTKLSAVFSIIVLSVLVIAMLPYFKLSSLQVSNDFLWVPERTLIAGKTVDNAQFIMQHRIGGLFKSSLVQSASALGISEDNSIPLSLTPALSQYLQAEQEYDYRYYYDNALQRFFFKAGVGISYEQKQTLCSLVSQSDCASIQMVKPQKIFDYTEPLIRQFINSNAYELANQILAGHYFYHHYAMLGPVSELLLGKNPTHVISVYGWGNTHLLAYLMAHIKGGVSFEKYIAVLYSGYPVYFIIFAMCCWVLLRDVRYVALACLANIALLLSTGFESLRLAPGFNPLRHLLDLPLLLFLYQYFTAKRLNLLYLIGAYISALFAVIANKEFGLMMFAALMGASFFHILFCNKKYRHFIVVGIAMVILGYVLVFLNEQNRAYSANVYGLLGVSVPANGMRTLFELFIIVIGGYLLLFAIASKRGYQYPKLYILLFLLFYSQCVWIYYVWYTERGHLVITASIWVTYFVFMLKEVLGNFLSNAKQDKLISYFILPLGILVFVGVSMGYFKDERAYKKIFTTHQVYQWNFPKAHFLSTMNPNVFSEAIEKINHYNQGPSIYIISKYDFLLSFLAEKYSAMPYSEMLTSLVSRIEVRESANLIRQAKPKYLFVDSDINESHFGDILDPADPLREVIDPKWLSFGRVILLNVLREVFNRVSNEYRLVDKGYLISVYERK